MKFMQRFLKLFEIYIAILAFAIPSSSIFSIEILLKTGEVFICDLLSEDEKAYKVNWKGSEYVFPKTDVQSADYNKKGSHISYRYSTFIMRDGSLIKGVIADQDKDNYTLKTDVGFLMIEKAKIAKQENDSKEEVKPPAIYSVGNEKIAETKIGFTGSGFANTGSTQNPSTFGGGWFVEPAFFGFRRNWQFGYKGEYLVSKGNRDYDFFNNFIYLQYNLIFSRFLSFYGNFGAGSSYVRSIKGQNTIAGIDPASYFEIGYQGLRFDKLFFRIGLRYIHIFESGSAAGMGGAEFSVGYAL